jgi:hypothetical protein
MTEFRSRASRLLIAFLASVLFTSTRRPGRLGDSVTVFRRGVWTPIGAGVTILTSITRAKIEGVKVQSVFTPGCCVA